MQQSKPWGVKGVTDAPRLPSIAKAKIGEQVPVDGQPGKTRPVRLDHIIFVEPQTGNKLPEYQEALGGEGIKSFTALLPSDYLEDIVDVAWKRYGNTGLKCRGDGERAVDRETGEERPCAGPYDFIDQSRHLCSYARPQGENKPPLCKPVLSMRLVVPQLPGLGVVQLDTGGVASSIPTLIAQLRLIENMTRDAQGMPHMSGIAVKVMIRAFPDKFGADAYAWQIEPLKEDEAAQLRLSIEGLVRIEGQVNLKALPPMDETPDPDIYGVVDEDHQIEAPAEPEVVSDEPTFGVPGEVVDAEIEYQRAVKASGLTDQRKQSAISTMEANRAQAETNGTWESYAAWLQAQTKRIPKAGAA